MKFFYRIIAIFLILICIQYSVFADDIEENEVVNIEKIIETSSNIYNSEPKLNSRVGVVYDRKSKRIIYNKNGDDRKAMASTTKIMTLLVAIEHSNLNEVVTVSKKAAGTGGSRLKINAGDKIKMQDLLYGLMLRSGNDAAVAIAEHIGGNVEKFVELMNEKAKELGLKDTHFVTPHGLDNSNHYTTGCELAKLADIALENEVFRKIVGTKTCNIQINGNIRAIANTNELLGNYQGVYGVKTGFTGNAGRCLVTAVKNDKLDLIVVVLGADTKNDRTKDSVKLINYVQNNYYELELENIIIKKFNEWNNINNNRIYINKAVKKEIELELSKIENTIIPIKNGEDQKLEIAINAVYQYEAPIEAGTKIGNVMVKYDNEIIEYIDIILKESIEKKGLKEYFTQLLENMWKLY